MTERPTVLVVDDEAAIRIFAEKTLTAAGYEPLTAEDAAEALCVIASHGPFDLFVIDVTMPEMLGTELASQIRGTNPTAKVLYFTATPTVCSKRSASFGRTKRSSKSQSR